MTHRFRVRRGRPVVMLAALSYRVAGAAVVCLFAGLALAGTAVAADAAPKRFTVAFVGGRTQDGSQTIRVRQGDAVELRFTSDKPLSLHLHGYDIQAKPRPGAPATMSFKASIPGRFPIEPHGETGGHSRAVAYLEVLP